MFSQFLDVNDKLIKINYFTARPLNIGKQTRQAVFLNVNKKLNPDKFNIVFGKYKKKPIYCSNCKEEFLMPEEKETDVNISVHMIGDCALNRVDKIILVSADSDLMPPLKFINENFSTIKVKIYFPPKRFSSDIYDFMKRKVVMLERNKPKFRKAIMEDIVTIDDDSYTIPENWK